MLPCSLVQNYQATRKKVIRIFTALRTSNVMLKIRLGEINVWCIMICFSVVWDSVYVFFLTAIGLSGVMGSAVWESPNLREWSIWQENALEFFEYIGVNSRIILKGVLKKFVRWVGWVVLSEEGCGLSRTWKYAHELIKMGNFVGFWSKCMLLKEVCAPESYYTGRPTLVFESKCRSPLCCALPMRQLLRHIHEACSVNKVTQACPLFCLSTGNWH